MYKTNLKSECSTKCLEERCVAQDYSQIRGIVFDETSKPVIKPTNIRVILNITVINHWKIHQFDVKNAF